MNWFLYDNGLRHEKVKDFIAAIKWNILKQLGKSNSLAL